LTRHDARNEDVRVPKRRDGETQDLCRRLQREFGTRLQRARKESGALQKGLAGELQLSRTSISNIERGTQRVFLDQVYTAAHALRVEVTVLLPSVADMFPAATVHSPADDPLSDSDVAAAGELARVIQARFARPALSPRKQLGNRKK
jgi:transcriptional regulator with XRE-family HTH domain